MSNKAKNLHFEAKQPAFLRRLRGEVDSSEDSPSRPVNQDLRRRAIKTSDENDDPTYILEDSGSTISKAEFDALVSAKDGPAEGGKVECDPTAKPVVSAESSSGKSAAAIGVNSKKRKATQGIHKDS